MAGGAQLLYNAATDRPLGEGVGQSMLLGAVVGASFGVAAPEAAAMLASRLGAGGAAAAASAGVASGGSRILTFDTSKGALQHAFKHAPDFGITANQSNRSLAQFSTALYNHVTSPATQAIQGTYRSTQQAVHYFNAQTNQWVATDPSGKFIAAYKLGTAQVENLMRSGNVQ